MQLFLITAVRALVSHAPWFYRNSKPLIVGNAGSSGMFPPYSSVGIQDACLNGADFIKVSVQVSFDNVLIANDSPCLKSSSSTDINKWSALYPKRVKDLMLDTTTCIDDF
jgi:glycerophosphoryl diester phosphodiesterase